MLCCAHVCMSVKRSEVKEGGSEEGGAFVFYVSALPSLSLLTAMAFQ